jgi:hypothetical protein
LWGWEAQGLGQWLLPWGAAGSPRDLGVGRETTIATQGGPALLRAGAGGWLPAVWPTCGLPPGPCIPSFVRPRSTSFILFLCLESPSSVAEDRVPARGRVVDAPTQGGGGFVGCLCLVGCWPQRSRSAVNTKRRAGKGLCFLFLVEFCSESGFFYFCVTKARVL